MGRRGGGNTRIIGTDFELDGIVQMLIICGITLTKFIYDGDLGMHISLDEVERRA